MNNRNSRCHCGSGKKYKRCHLQADYDAAHPGARMLAPSTSDDTGSEGVGTGDASVDQQLRHRIGAKKAQTASLIAMMMSMPPGR